MPHHPRNSLFLLLFLTCSALAFTACRETQIPTANAPTTVHLFAAAGTSAVCEAILHNTAASSPTVQRNYASSGTLARQISEGAQADVFLSANRRWVDFLTEQGLLEKNTIRPLATTPLVLISPLEELYSGTNQPNLPKAIAPDQPPPAGRGVVGDPNHVPVGAYARQALESLGWWESLAPDLIRAKDVNTVLRLVESGEADWGIVYRSETAKSSKIRVIHEFPENLHHPILFLVARTATASPAATALYEALLTPANAHFWIAGGFSTTPPIAAAAASPSP